MITINKLKHLNTLIFSTLFLLFSFNAQAKEFADKAFYLIDSLVLEDLSEEDRAEIDSILPLYHAAKNDTQKLNLLENLVELKWVDSIWINYNDFFLNQVESKLGKTTNEILKAKKNHYEGAYHFNNGYTYENQGDLDKALTHYHLALEKFSAINDLTWMGDIANMIAISHYRSGDLDKALEYYKIAIKHWTPINEYDGLSVCNIGIATIMQNNGFTDKAKSYYKIAYEHAQKSTDSYDRMGNIKVNLSKIASKEGDNNLAIELIDSALFFYKKINYTPGIAHAYFTLGYLNDDLGNSNLALQYCEKAYEVAKETNNINLKLVIINKLGELELKKGSYNRSEKYAEDAMNLASQS